MMALVWSHACRRGCCCRVGVCIIFSSGRVLLLLLLPLLLLLLLQQHKKTGHGPLERRDRKIIAGVPVACQQS